MSQRISYNKCWKLLIDKGWTKKDLRLATGIGSATIAKMAKGENMQTDILLKDCDALKCELWDIM